MTVLPLLAFASCVLVAADAPPPSGTSAATRAVEAVRLRDGRRYEGLIESEDDTWVNLIEVQRPSGRPMYLVIRPLERSAIESVSRLPSGQREALRREIESFRHRARIEAGHMESVRLDSSRKAGIEYRHYAGPWFGLDTTTDELTTRRIVVRVEQAFTAYRQLLPPRQPAARLPRIIVFGSRQEYQQYLADLGLKLASQACFLPEQNLVLASSDLAAYSAELNKVAASHQRLRQELASLQEKLPKRLQEYAQHLRQNGLANGEISRLLNLEKQKAQKDLADKQKQMQTFERQNARQFEKLTAVLFRRLYHEAFHAYMENFVFPQSKYDVPRWLAEGLATMVEGGQFESGVLRIDAPHRELLRRLKADLTGARPNPLDLADLLVADQKAFIEDDLAQNAAAEHYYAAAWGLTYFLTFQEDLLAGPRWLDYLAPASAALPAADRFAKLVGRPLAEFESQWRSFVLGLRS